MNELRHKFDSRDATVAIIGLGYVGLPLAHAFATAGLRVLGFDSDPTKTAKLNAGTSYIRQFPDSIIGEMLGRGFRASHDFSELSRADAVILCVPTPLNEAQDPDLTFVSNSAKSVARTLRPGQLVVLESTTYPGTTRDVVLPILEATGLVHDRDFLLAYSPEREDPGNPHNSLTRLPKVIGGISPTATELASLLYGTVVPQVVPVASPEIAEASKILENVYRAVNIALVNEMKVLLDRIGVPIWDVIEAAKTKPFGFQAFYPGPGLGGHCIPIDPFYLAWLARKNGLRSHFIELAGEVNQSMPGYVIGKAADALNHRRKPIKGSKILVIGVAYKRDVDDCRESPGLEIVAELRRRGALAIYHDPCVPRIPRTRAHPDLNDVTSVALSTDLIASQDCTIVVTDHTAIDWAAIARHACLIVDTRNAMAAYPEAFARTVRA